MGQAALADIYLVVGEKLEAFERPDKKAPLVRVLKIGEKYPHTGRRGRGFLEILDADDTKLYVKRDDMFESQLKDIKPKTLHNNSQFGVDFYYSAHLQGDRELQTGTDTTYDVSSFKGSSFFFGGYFSTSIFKEWVGRVSLKLRQNTMEGDAKLQGSMTSNKSVFLLTQNFASLGVALSRPFIKPNMYLLGEVEFAKGTDVDLKVTSGTPVDTSDVKNPFFVVFSGGLGYHKKLSNNFLLSPEFKVGFVSTSDPFILLIEGRVGIAYLM